MSAITMISSEYMGYNYFYILVCGSLRKATEFWFSICEVLVFEMTVV